MTFVSQKQIRRSFMTELLRDFNYQRTFIGFNLALGLSISASSSVGPCWLPYPRAFKTVDPSQFVNDLPFGFWLRHSKLDCLRDSRNRQSTVLSLSRHLGLLLLAGGLPFLYNQCFTLYTLSNVMVTGLKSVCFYEGASCLLFMKH